MGIASFNIDRRYPITRPTFQMRRGSHVTVYVFYPFTFEALTLDAGTAQAFESSDQAAALVTAAVPIGKGAVLGLVDSGALGTALVSNKNFMNTANIMGLDMGARPNRTADVTLAQEILSQLRALDDLLTQAIVPVPQYFNDTREIYASIREIESPEPRPVADVQNKLLRYQGVDPDKTPNPWSHYSEWRGFITQKITQQGQDTTGVLDRLPGVCQKSTDPAPTIGPWLPSARRCKDDAKPGFRNPDSPFVIAGTYDSLYEALTDNIGRLPAGRPDPDTYKNIQDLKTQLDQRKQRVSQAIPIANELLPALIAKISPDMQTLLANVNAVRSSPPNPTMLGVIPPPPHSQKPTQEEKVLATYKALAPTITYTVNAQNEIANSLLSLPATTQKQAIATITVLFAQPRFEGSAGAFFSWLPNRAFSNYTDTRVTGGVPAPADVRINMTKTIPPLVIPFVAANYRISPEFTWLGKRRGALYATAGVALNPYDTQVEYAAGLSLSWRYLIFGPMFHLGHSTHLTQGEQVGQLWCQYGNGATATTTPPVCAGAPPAPSTKMFWRGAFAFGIGVRVPTTYSGTNH